MKDMRVEVKLLTCPLLYEELPEFIVFPVMKTSPLTLLLHVPQLHTSQTTSQCTATYHLADISSICSSSHTSTLLPLHSMHIYKPPAQLTYTICDHLEDEEDFQTVALDDNHWITDPIQVDICTSMNIQNLTFCVATHAHTWTVLQHHTRTLWISVTFLILKM